MWRRAATDLQAQDLGDYGHDKPGANAAPHRSMQHGDPLISSSHGVSIPGHVGVKVIHSPVRRDVSKRSYDARRHDEVRELDRWELRSGRRRENKYQPAVDLVS